MLVITIFYLFLKLYYFLFNMLKIFTHLYPYNIRSTNIYINISKWLNLRDIPALNSLFQVAYLYF